MGTGLCCLKKKQEVYTHHEPVPADSPTDSPAMKEYDTPQSKKQDDFPSQHPMAHLVKKNKDLCDFSQFTDCESPGTHWVHDKLKIRWIHDDAKILEVLNRGLKITKHSITSAGQFGIAATVGTRLGTRAYAGKPFKMGARTSGMSRISLVHTLFLVPLKN